MTAPVLVRAYTSSSSSTPALRKSRGSARHALPPISSFAFADILREADSPEFQQAIDGIAEICAKNRMSLADEYAAHLPPLGEITASSSAKVKPHLMRPGMRPALTSVPEGSSGSSEGSRKSKRRNRNLFGFAWQKTEVSKPLRQIRIGSMGRSISVGTTTAYAAHLGLPSAEIPIVRAEDTDAFSTGSAGLRATSPAQSSLRLLLFPHGGQPG